MLASSFRFVGALALACLGAQPCAADTALRVPDSLWARAIAWGESDIDDHRRFPLRVVANAGPRFDFRQPSAEMRRHYAPALATITHARDGESVTEGLDEFLKRNDTVAFLVIKDDTLLYEGYFDGYARDSTVTSFSIAKSFVSALVGIAIADGHIGSVEDPITAYVPELLEKDSRYRSINLRHLLTMASGIRYEEGRMPWSDNAATYYAPDLRTLAVSSPIAGPPGQAFRYNNFNPLLLGLVLERSTGRSVARYLEEKIWKPLGMEASGSWSLDSEKSGFEKMESGINGRAIDFAKFGRLFLNKGNWNGAQIVPAAWVDQTIRLDVGTDPAPHYQYFWWVNTKAPGNHFYAAGKHGQYIYVVPEQNLIFVRFGRSDRFRRWLDVFEQLAGRIDSSIR